MKHLLSLRVHVFLGLFITLLTAIAYATAQTVDTGNSIYIRNENGIQEVVDYYSGQSLALMPNTCNRYSTHRTALASYRLEMPEQIAFIEIETGTVIGQVSWRSEWGNRENNPLFCSATTGWLDNTTFRLPGMETDQYYDINVFTGQVSEPITINSFLPELPLFDPRISELGLGVAGAFAPSLNQAIYSQCEDQQCNQARYVLYDTIQQRVITELHAPEFGFYYARLVPGNTLISWSHDERYVAISSESAVLAVYDNVEMDWFDLSFLPSSFGLISQLTGGWNWSPDNSHVAFAAHGLSAMGYPFDVGIMTINLISRTYQAFELESYQVNQIVWLPSGNGLLITSSDGDLYQLNIVEPNFMFVDDHVTRILTWYSPVSAPTLTPTPASTLTPSSTPTPTNTPTATFTPTPTRTLTTTPLPLPPANTNLLTNPSFASGLAPWQTVNFSAGGVVNDVLQVTRPTFVIVTNDNGYTEGAQDI